MRRDVLIAHRGICRRTRGGEIKDEQDIIE